MAKQYGALVGAPRQLVPPRMSAFGLDRAKNEVIVRDTVLLAAAAADTVRLAVLGWESILDPNGCHFWSDDLGTGGTVSIGDVTYPNALANAVNTDSAALGATSMLTALSIANYFKPLWAQLGYATLAAALLVGDRCELLLTRNTAAGAGNISWQMKGSRR